MTREQWQNVRKILERALDLDPAECATYLDEACAGDAELRREIDSLLAANDQATRGFLTGKAIDQVGDLVELGSDTLQGRRIGPYQVLEEIGHGGMGTVYRAVRADDQYQKQVAIKVVRGGLGDRLAIQRFKAERQILANLDHANIARLLDGGATEDGRPYVVMEYIEGLPIDEYADSRRLNLRARLKLFRTVCSAVAFAHQRLVIHRDIKPANILVTESGDPKLLDFGIAKILDDQQSDGGEATVTLVRMMTPEYASPEQVRGEPVTTATDVYSLGVVLYGLLTGRRPYRVSSKTPHDMVQAVLETEPEKPSIQNRRLRGDLDNIVLKALRKEPERRYASVEQFSDDIGKHLDGLPVSARPDTLAYRGSKFVRRQQMGCDSGRAGGAGAGGGHGGDTARSVHRGTRARDCRAALQRYSPPCQLAAVRGVRRHRESAGRHAGAQGAGGPGLAISGQTVERGQGRSIVGERAGSGARAGGGL